MMNDEEALDSFIPRLCLQYKKKVPVLTCLRAPLPLPSNHCLLFAATPLYKVEQQLFP